MSTRIDPATIEVGHLVKSKMQNESGPTTAAQSAIDVSPSTSPGEGGGGGEEGQPTPFPSSTPVVPTNAEFLKIIFANLPEGARPIVTAKGGDPGQGAWLAQDARRVEEICSADQNTYFNCASVNPTERGELRAKKEQAAAYHTLVLDDVGTKVDRALLPPIEPTWELETSRGNFQIGFVLATPVDDPELVEDAQSLIAQAGLCDKGAQGMTRWVRLPNGCNGKPKHADPDGKGFRCKLTAWNPAVSYELDDLVARLVPDGAFGLCSSSQQKSPHTVKIRASRHGISDEVFIRASDEHPVVTALKERGLYKRETSPGIHDITCPWVEEHTGPDNGAAYLEPSPRHPLGGFKCHHTHGENYKLKDMLEALGKTRSDVRNRPVIRIIEGELMSVMSAAQVVLAQTGQYFQSGGSIVKVAIDPVTGGALLQPQNDADLTLALAALTDFERPTKEDKWRRCNPPPACVRLLVQAQAYDHLPHIKGIARQPFLSDGGELINSAGFHKPSGLFCAFDPERYRLPDPAEPTARAALGRLEHLIHEFRFASPRDKATAICAIFTAVLRPCLGRAPAFHYRAPSPGSGKSLLSDVTARFAGPGHPAKVSYPRTEEEATKVVLASLIQAPAVLDFDDMTVDWRPWGAVNRLLTSTTMTDRILGASKMVTVSTDTLVLGSGNNTGPVGDLCRRVLVIDLDTRDESPATIKYQGDPLAAVEADRDRYVGYVLLIVSAWIAAGRPKADLSPIATYGGKWSDYCRQTLVWLGLDDPATGFIEQLREDPDVITLGHLLEAWHNSFAEKPKTLRALMYDADEALIEAIENLPFVEGGPVNRTKFGYYLKRNANRPVRGFRLEKAQHSERTAWRVVKVSPPTPALPPASLSAAEPVEQDEGF
jgi:hypothetical protein